MALPSLNMAEINFSAPAICVGVKVSQLKVINLQSERFNRCCVREGVGA